jgi:adenylate kinase family enzyme
MKSLLHQLSLLLKGVTVYALVGKSGTGKSFRAKLVAQKYGIDLIIDDGLLIKDQKIVAGKSAKREKAYLAAIKTALFDNRNHREDVRRKLEEYKFKKILIIGTSERMVRKIVDRLGLKAPSRIINIEEIASTSEIETAMRSRKHEGKHIIPVPAIEISRDYPHILYDSVKVFLKNKLSLWQRSKVFEKSVVRPDFGRKGRVTISEAALTQMVMHCADEFNSSITVRKVTVRNDAKGYSIGVYIHVPYGLEISGNLHSFREYIVDNLERYAGILVDRVNVTIDDFSRLRR